MKKRIFKSLICFLLAVIMVTECNLGALTTYAAEIIQEEVSDEIGTEEDEEEEFIPTGSSYLYPFEEAVTALEELAKTNVIQGVIYLVDEVTMRTLPEEGSEPLKNLPSGSVVDILGAGQDAGYQIWYKVLYQNEYEEVIGYVPKDNLICVNSAFVQWEENYVRSIAMFGRMRGAYIPTDISAFPQSYQQGLSSLKAKHPNWTFVRLDTKVNWETMLKKQEGNPSWIYSVGIPESWKAGDTKTTNWAYASRGIIRYYMDPRNWLSDEYVFQFELLGFDSQLHTIETIEKVLAGSFMANKMIDGKMTYAQAFLEIGRANQVSPIFLAARVIQEQGYQGKSDMISGNYPGYENYYNYFNIKASGNGDKETIENGLKYAKENGWNTRYKALEAGIRFLMTDYIRVGQNTLYLQKFDSVGEIATHQYMQNIKAPAQESSMVFKGYNNSGMLSQPFVFIIPVYENMPSKAATKPGEEDKITLSSTKIENLQVDSEVTLQPLVNGKIVPGARFGFSSSDSEVAKVDATGTIKALKVGETTITCRDMDDPENPNVGTCKVTIVPADIDIATLKLPELKAITYDPNKTLQDVKLPAGYTWVNPEIIPCVNQSLYAVIYNPNEEKYNPISLDLSLEVKKKTLTIADCTMPTDLTGGAGRELSSVALPVGFYWNDPTELLPDTIGTKQYLVSYNPDVSNYETLNDIKVIVSIVCEKHQLSDWVITEATCEENGSKVRNCKICQYKEELVLEKTGHHYESVITEEATEEQEGIRTYTCKNCDSNYTESIPKLPSTHVHKYEEEVTKKASCTESGLKTFTCSCEDKYTEIIEATGHKMDNGRCQNCGYTEDVETPKEDNKPAEDGSKEEVKPNEPADDGSKEEVKPNEPTDGGNKEETKPDKPSTDGDKDEVNADKPSDNDSDNSSNNASDNNGTTNNNNNSTANNSSTNTTTPDNNVTNNNTSTGSTTNNTTNNTTSSDKTTENKKPETTEPSTETKPEVKPEETKPQETKPQTTESSTETKTEVKPEETKPQETKPEVKPEETKPQNTVTSTENKSEKETEDSTDQVEIDLMSEMIENVKEENETTEKQTVAIQLNKNTDISQKIVEMAKEHGVDLEVSLPNNLKWTINAESLNDKMASTINMNAEIVEEVVDKKAIETVTSTEEYMELSLSHDGEFGFEATLTIPVEEKYVGQIANLFYFNEKTKELEFQMDAPVDEEGNIQLFFNHASDYVIVFSQNSMADVVTNVGTLTDEGEVTEEITETEEIKSKTGGLMAVCIIIMILAGGLAVAGYFIYFNKKEISDGQDFEEWLKADNVKKEETEGKVTAEKEKHAEKKSALKKDEYLDEDVDDYQEREKAPEVIFNTGEIRLREEDYLDEDVDDYYEKNGNNNQDEYLDEDVDDYREKN